MESVFWLRFTLFYLKNTFLAIFICFQVYLVGQQWFLDSSIFFHMFADFLDRFFFPPLHNWTFVTLTQMQNPQHTANIVLLSRKTCLRMYRQAFYSYFSIDFLLPIFSNAFSSVTNNVDIFLSRKREVKHLKSTLLQNLPVLVVLWFWLKSNWLMFY